MNDKNARAEALFDALGDIDDQILVSAYAYRPARTKRRVVPALLAACFGGLLTLTLLLVASVQLFNRSSSKDAAQQAEGAPADPLMTVLEDAANDAAVQTVASADAIDLFDGEAKLIWQSSDGAYHVLPLSAASCASLERQMGSGDSLPSDDDAVCSVWLANGDGTTVSPYLNRSDGNVGYGALLEYAPEIVPSDAFASHVQEILSST